MEEKTTQELSKVELDHLIDFYDRRYKRIHPDDPPRSNVLRRKQLLEIDPYWKPTRWFVWNANKDKLIGFGEIGRIIEGAPDYEENRQSCWGTVLVEVDFRRQAIGTKLMVNVFQKALELNKTSIGIGTFEKESLEYVDHIGIGLIAIEGGESKLRIEDIDWNKMKKWINENPAVTDGVTIETFEDVPEDYIEEYSRLYTFALNLVPKGEEEWEAIITPEARRKDEKRHKEKGSVWITKVSKEANGNLSGLTEIFYNEENSHFISQELTGVLPEYRSRGLGKWLKAEMLFYIKDRFPNIKYLITGNADINAPMLAINKQMGYKKRAHWTSFKFVKSEMESFIKKYKI